jgi:hypothetical protein
MQIARTMLGRGVKRQVPPTTQLLTSDKADDELAPLKWM